MMNAVWFIFSRLYCKKYNNFLVYCPHGLKNVIEQFGIVGIQKKYRDMKVIIFECPENLVLCDKITQNDTQFIIKNRDIIYDTICKLSSYFSGINSNVLTDYECWLLESNLNKKIRRHVAVNYSITQN